jgi:hypothetical protein
MPTDVSDYKFPYFLPWKTGFAFRAVHMEFVMGKVKLR